MYPVFYMFFYYSNVSGKLSSAVCDDEEILYFYIWCIVLFDFHPGALLIPIMCMWPFV